MSRISGKKGLEGILSKIRNKALPIILAPIITLCSYTIAKADYDLKFEHSIDANNSIYVAEDTFNTIGSNLPEVLVGYDFIKDVLQGPPPPSEDYVQAFTTVDTKNLTKDAQPFDPNLSDNTWLINLNAFDDTYTGLTGTAHFNLADPNALDDLPPYALAIAQRQDANGLSIQNYNLDETPNISWPVTNVQEIHSKMELNVIDEYLRIARLCPTEPVIKFNHFAVWAKKWQETGPNGEDINGNNKVDYKDLKIFARNWLYSGE